jgi:hypothetical protein
VARYLSQYATLEHWIPRNKNDAREAIAFIHFDQARRPKYQSRSRGSSTVGSSRDGTVTGELLAIEYRASTRSLLWLAGIVSEGAVRLVELAVPCPLLTSTGAAPLTPLYAATPPAASLPSLKVKV